MRIPLGIDISETFEIDFCLEAGKADVEIWEEVLRKAQASAEAAKAGDEKKAADDAAKAEAEKAIAEAAARVEVAEKGLATAKAELAAYEPGTGPFVTLGLIPGAKRAELGGMARDSDATKTEREGEAADHAWRREVVRWAVRGHRGMKLRSGAEQPFEAEKITIAGEIFTLPTERQIERYAQAGMLPLLVRFALAQQGLGSAEKNA